MFSQQSTRAAVPSRGALRVLRRLALAGSTIGAIGGICTVGTITYDMHRRIRFAERIVENKRSLQTSCPNYDATAGASSMAEMMEAAEAGEFLGLESMKKRRRKGVGSDGAERDDTGDVFGGGSSTKPHEKDKLASDAGVGAGSGGASMRPDKNMSDMFKSKIRAVDRESPPLQGFQQNEYLSKLDWGPSLASHRQAHKVDSALPSEIDCYQLLEQGRSLAATHRFLYEFQGEGAGSEASVLKLGIFLFYENLRRGRFSPAKLMFDWLERKKKISPAIWEVMLLALGKRGSLAHLRTLYLKYADDFKLSPALMMMVLSALLTSRLSAAKTLLFENLKHDSGCYLSSIYLLGLWKKTRSLELVETQFQKLLVELRRHGVALTPALFNPVLAAYVELGLNDKIESHIKMMNNAYNVEPATQTLGLVAYSQALSCNWSGVTEWLQKMHDLKKSVDDPRNFNKVFHRVFLEFWLANDGESIYKFVFDAIHKYQLVPDSMTFQTIIKAFVQKGTAQMVEEFLQVVEEKGWNLTLTGEYFTELLRTTRLSIQMGSVGLYRSHRASAQQFSYAAASRHLLGHDRVSFPFEAAKQIPRAKEHRVIHREEGPVPEITRSVDHYLILHLDMMQYINAGKFKEALKAFDDAAANKFIMKRIHVNLAVTASMMLHGDTRKAKAILKRHNALRAFATPDPPEFFQSVMDADCIPESMARTMALLNYYNIREEWSMPVKHHALVSLASQALKSQKPSIALRLFRTISQSKYGAMEPFSAPAIKVIAHAFAYAGVLKGVVWAIYTALSRPSALTQELVVAIYWIIERSERRRVIPVQMSREEYFKTLADIKFLAPILNRKLRENAKDKHSKVGLREILTSIEQLKVSMTKDMSSELKPQANTSPEGTAGYAPDHTLESKFDIQNVQCIVNTWEERRQFDRCFPPQPEPKWVARAAAAAKRRVIVEK
ncbi:hypothetical protein FQN55_000902 [Onygenales sp. PD_40]|nr:hypothetical protein FQN55_000902 [Onygenales sp. PD_40]KAK2781996.1 hypothetical protein FQN53_000246 [Emmonsiellopsis sp. PD_33]KAK2803733.1 hypothetical protein FQN51_002962 [Onygenales sp. PD_10]